MVDYTSAASDQKSKWIKAGILLGIGTLVLAGIVVWTRSLTTVIISPIVDNPQPNISESTQQSPLIANKAKDSADVLLEITKPKDWSTAEDNKIIVAGKTDSHADVFVGNERLQAEDNGNFRISQSLEKGINYISVAASNTNGKYNEKEIIVRYEPNQENLSEAERTIFSSLAVITRRDGVSAPNMVFDVESNSRRFKAQLTMNTKFRNKFYGEPKLDNIASGHMLAIYGTWSDPTHTVLQCQLVRDTSNESRYSIRVGNVLTLSGNTLILDSTNGGTQRATMQQSTEFIDRQGKTITLPHIQMGHNVRIYGLLNPDSNTITDVKEVKDYSLP